MAVLPHSVAPVEAPGLSGRLRASRVGFPFETANLLVAVNALALVGEEIAELDF
jgi:hypothetical protein